VELSFQAVRDVSQQTETRREVGFIAEVIVDAAVWEAEE
jgi:hypothetical protein